MSSSDLFADLRCQPPSIVELLDLAQTAAVAAHPVAITEPMDETAASEAILQRSRSLLAHLELEANPFKHARLFQTNGSAPLSFGLSPASPTRITRTTLLYWLLSFELIPEYCNAQMIDGIAKQSLHSITDQQRAEIHTQISHLLRSQLSPVLRLLPQLLSALLSSGAITETFLCASGPDPPLAIVCATWRRHLHKMPAESLHSIAAVVEWLTAHGARTGDVAGFTELAIQQGTIAMRIKLLRGLPMEQLLAIELDSAQQAASRALTDAPFSTPDRLWCLVLQPVVRWQREQRASSLAALPASSASAPCSNDGSDLLLQFHRWLDALRASLPRLLLASSCRSPSGLGLDALCAHPPSHWSLWHLAETPLHGSSLLIALMSSTESAEHTRMASRRIEELTAEPQSALRSSVAPVAVPLTPLGEVAQAPTDSFTFRASPGAGFVIGPAAAAPFGAVSPVVAVTQPAAGPAPRADDPSAAASSSSAASPFDAEFTPPPTRALLAYLIGALLSHTLGRSDDAPWCWAALDQLLRFAQLRFSGRSLFEPEHGTGSSRSLNSASIFDRLLVTQSATPAATTAMAQSRRSAAPPDARFMRAAVLLHQFGVDRDELGRSLSCVLIERFSERLLKLWLQPERAAYSMTTDWLSEPEEPSESKSALFSSTAFGSPGAVAQAGPPFGGFGVAFASAATFSSAGAFNPFGGFALSSGPVAPAPFGGFPFGTAAVAPASAPVAASSAADSAPAPPQPVCRLLQLAKRSAGLSALFSRAPQSPAASVLRTLESAIRWWSAAVLPQLQSELDAHLLPELRSIVLGYLAPDSLLKSPVLPGPPAESVLHTRRLIAQLSPLTASSPLASHMHDQLLALLAQLSREEAARCNQRAAAEAAAELQL